MEIFAGKIYFDLEIIFYTVIPQVSAHAQRWILIECLDNSLENLL